jgi:ferritin-like protein
MSWEPVPGLRVLFKREIDRRSVLRGAAVLGLVGATGAVAGRGLRSSAVAQSSDTTIDLLNLAFTVESLVVACSRWALNQEFLTDRDRQVLEPAQAHQQMYCDTIREAIAKFGGTPIDEPEYHATDAIRESRDACLRTMWELQETTIKAWQGQIPLATDAALVPLLRPMVMHKGCHAAALGMLIEGVGQAFPGAIEPTIPLPEALQAMEDFRGPAR